MIAGAMERARGGHWLPQELQARRATLRRGRGALGQQRDRLTEAYLSGVIPLGEYERRRREIEARLVGLERQEQQLAADAARDGETAKLARHVETFCRRVQEGLAVADFAGKRALLELLVDRVVVTDGAVEIRYALPTGPDAEHEPFCRLRSDYRTALGSAQELATDRDPLRPSCAQLSGSPGPRRCRSRVGQMSPLPRCVVPG
jgi:site-specific DNA recombinase